MSKLFLLIVIIERLTIDLNETVELHDLALSHKLLLASDTSLLVLDTNRYRCLLDFGISHLTGDSTFPYQLIQTLLLGRALNFNFVHIGRTDSLVGLLSTFRTGVVLTSLTVFLTVDTYDLLLAGTQAEFRKVY